ncbi:MAG: hypothetical protein ACOX67_09965 [Oscillospiraceae bacterium]
MKWVQFLGASPRDWPISLFSFVEIAKRIRLFSGKAYKKTRNQKLGTELAFYLGENGGGIFLMPPKWKQGEKTIAV